MTCAYGWAVSAAAARTTKASLSKSGAQPGTKDIDREARESRGSAPHILAAAAAPPCDDDQAPDRTADTRAVLASCQTPQFDPTRPRQCAHRASPRGAVTKPLSACSLSQARWCIRGRRNGAHVHPRDRPRGQTGFAGLIMLPASRAALVGFASIESIPSSVNRGRHAAPLARASVTSRWRHLRPDRYARTVFRPSPHRPDALESRPRAGPWDAGLLGASTWACPDTACGVIGSAFCESLRHSTTKRRK
jgi:hypothetical protein